MPTAVGAGDDLAKQAKNFKSAVNEKGSIAKDGKYIFADDGYIIQDGDLVKEYMKGGGFVPADSIGKVGKTVGNYNEYLTIRKITNNKPFKQGVNPQTKTDNSVILKKIDDIYKQAPKAKIENDAFADMLVKKHGGTVSKTANKKKETSIEKVIKRKGGDISQLKDVVRNTIVKEGDYSSIVKELKDNGYTIKTVIAETDPFGYSGINAKINKKGIWRETQVNTPDMIYAKEPLEKTRAILGDDVFNMLDKKYGGTGGKGHKMYAKGRGMKKDSPEFIKITEESKKYYSNFR